MKAHYKKCAFLVFKKIIYKINKIYIMEYLAGGKSSHEEDLTKLREDFIEKYCNQNGWDKKSLTIEQMNIIRSHKEYSAPYLIRG